MRPGNRQLFCWIRSYPMLPLVLWVFPLLVCSSTPAAEPPKMPVTFTDVAQQAGVTLENVCGDKTKNYILEVNGNGAAFFDFDNDGDLDLLIVNGSTLRNLEQGGNPMAALYENEGKGRFTDVTSRSGMQRRGWGMGVCAADYNNDGFSDVYITAYGSNVLYRNNGDGTFSDVTEQAGTGDRHWSTNCAFGDYDRDGFVDLYVANYLHFDLDTVPKRGSNELCRYMGRDVLCGPRGLRAEPDVLYRNRGDGTFVDVTEAAGVTQPPAYGFGVVFTDLDNDGWPEIYVANDSKASFLFRNQRDGTFVEEGLLAGVALNAAGTEQASMGIAVGDYNNDNFFDIFVTNFSQDSNVLYQNDGTAFFTDVTFPAGLGASSMSYLGWGTQFVDLDNDGFLDIFIANGHVYPEIDDFGTDSKYLEPKQVYQNLGNAKFREVTHEIGGPLLTAQSSRGAAFGDYDNDGDIDVLVTNLNDRPNLLRNEYSGSNRWVSVRLRGTRSNRDGIGARLFLRTPDRTLTREVRAGESYLSHNDLRVHFGLGDASRIEELEVRWPSGLKEKFEGLKLNTIHVLREGGGNPVEPPEEQALPSSSLR